MYGVEINSIQLITLSRFTPFYFHLHFLFGAMVPVSSKDGGVTVWDADAVVLNASL